MLYESAVTGANDTDALYALAMTVAEQGDAKRILLVSKAAGTVAVRVAGAAGKLATVLAGEGAEPGFHPPTVARLDADGGFALGSYGVALVEV